MVSVHIMCFRELPIILYQSMECLVNEERNSKTHLFHELEQLALGRTGVAKEQNVDVTS